MKRYPDIFAYLRHAEGEVLHAYQDTEGYWTIGIGRCIDKLKGGITQEEAGFLLAHDVEKVNEGLDNFFPWWRRLAPNQRMVMQSMAFQMGIGGLSKFKRFLEAAQRGAHGEAARHMLQSKWAQQTPKRAQELAEMWTWTADSR